MEGASDPRKRGLDLEDDTFASEDGDNSYCEAKEGQSLETGNRRKRLAVGGSRSPTDRSRLKREGVVNEEDDDYSVDLTGKLVPTDIENSCIPPVNSGGAVGVATAGEKGGGNGATGEIRSSSTSALSAITTIGGVAAAAAASTTTAPSAVVTTEDLKPISAPTPLSVRCLVTTKDAGVIIGKGGKNVSEIRTRSQAKITISDMVPGAQERILTVAGTVDVVAKAFELLAQKVLDEISTPENRILSTSIRILAPHIRMGSIIGKGGTKIKEMQEASGARILASEAILPESTERTVTVSGAPEAIRSALYQIGRILQDQPPASTVPYRPSAARSSTHPAYGPIASTAATAAGPLQAAPQAHHQAQTQTVYADPYATVGAYGYAAHPPVSPVAPPFHQPTHPAVASVSHQSRPGVANPQAAVAAAAAPPGTQAQQIFVPNDMVGCIIGKGGSRINEIRQLSGCSIKIAEPNGRGTERLVTITGTPEANQMALYLLYSRIELEKSRAPAGY